VPALRQAGPGRPSHARALSRELVLSRARGSRRSRVLRDMGARGACFTSSRPWATFSRRCPFEGRYRLEPGARAARGFCVAWVPAAPALHQAGPERPSHVDIPSRVVIVWSQRLVPLEGFAWHGYPRRLLYIKQVLGGPLTSISLRGLLSSGARGLCRSRVLRGMGARGACFTSSRSRAAFSRRYPIEGCFCLEPGIRPARGFSLLGKGPGH
jgi:hypothetical protein